VNDAEDGYQADELDSALLSRFLQVVVVPDVVHWTDWARLEGAVHEEVIEFVANCPGIFEDPDANPRAWTYVGKLLRRFEAGRYDSGLLTTCLAGLVGDKWAVAFLQARGTVAKPLSARTIIDDYSTCRPVVTRWMADCRLDLVAASLENLKRHLQPQTEYNRVIADKARKNHVETFLSDLPPDLKRGFVAWMGERGFTELAIPRNRRRR
jgi:hypothetical protein